MSFILDALRKSDARRQQSSAPGLNSPEPPQPPRRRRLLPGLATAGVLLAVLATAVYFVRPGWLPLDIGDDPSAQVSDNRSSSPSSKPDSSQAGQAESSNAATPDVEQLARAEQVPDEAETGTTADTVASSNAEQSQAQSDRSRERRRRRVPPGEQEGVVQSESPQRETAPVSAEDATEELERRMAEAASRRRGREAVKRSPDEPENTRQPDRQASPPTGEQESESGTEELEEGVAEYVRAWELPLSVRRSLPELNLTIHVYSPNELERFVLINGERRVAGDEIDGARIVDIRREGAVVDFRSHRFLLEPR